MKLSKRQFNLLTLYLLSLAIASVVIHESAHILAALSLGAQFSDLKLGFYGINPSVTLPEWFTGIRHTAFHYAGGLLAGTALLMLYLLYWVRRYRRSPTFFHWALGLVTVVLAGMQLATGYLEGRYHAAYIIGAGSLFSPTNILIYSWGISALFFHLALCPLRRMNATDGTTDAGKTELKPMA